MHYHLDHPTSTPFELPGLQLTLQAARVDMHQSILSGQLQPQQPNVRVCQAK